MWYNRLRIGGWAGKPPPTFGRIFIKMPPTVLLLSAVERLRKHKRLDTAQVPAWSGYLNRAFFSKDRHNAFGMTRGHYRGGDAPDGE